MYKVPFSLIFSLCVQKIVMIIPKSSFKKIPQTTTTTTNIINTAIVETAKSIHLQRLKTERSDNSHTN